jgi:hypothetical protein
MSAATFTATYLNPALLALATCNWGPTAPANGPGSAPAFGQCWINTSASPNDTVNFYDGASWVTTGTINTSTHAWTLSGNVACSQLPALSGGVSSAAGSCVTTPSAGIAANTLNAQTSNYTIATTDCSKTVQAGTGSTGKFTITLPAVSGFDPKCTVLVLNGDTAAGKILSGFPAGTFPVLFPWQAIQVQIVNGVWATTINPGPWYAQSSVTFQVDHTNGSDTTGDGLGSSTRAFATIGHAGKVASQALFNGVAAGFVNIQVNDASFTESPAFVGGTNSQEGAIIITGNAGSPGSVVMNTAGITADNGAVIVLSGFTFRTTGSGLNVINVSKMGIVAVINEIWSSAVGGNFVSIATGGTFVSDAGTHQVGDGTSSSFNYFVQNNGGRWNSPGAQAFTVSGAQTFTAWYSGSGGDAVTNFTAAQTYSGTGSGASSTGLQFQLANSATIDANTRATTFPGTGSTNSGIYGTTSNDAAPGGYVGEYIAAAAPSNAVTSTVTITIASPAVITWTGNPYGVGSAGSGNWTAPITFTTSGALPTGLTAGQVYWVIGNSINGNTFKVATSIANALAGTAVNTSGTQSGTQTGTGGMTLANSAATNVAAISLPPGDYDVSLSLNFVPAATTNVTADYASWNATSATNDLTTPGRQATLQYGASGFVTGNASNIVTTPQTRLLVSATTTYYAVATSVFTLSTESVCGILIARRRH